MNENNTIRLTFLTALGFIGGVSSLIGYFMNVKFALFAFALGMFIVILPAILFLREVNKPSKPEVEHE